MEDVLASCHGSAAVVEVPDVTDDECEAVGVLVYQRDDVFNVSCGEIVEAGYGVPFPEEVFAKVGADESGSAGDKYVHAVCLGFIIF